jgi:hypothetical protein
MDLFVVPTIGFDLLYALVIVRLARRDLVWINVTTHPTADWIARQITEAFPWAEVPRYVVRDRDCVYGAAVTHRLRTMGIRDKPIAPGSPWQNAFAERLIGRECVDHLVVLGEAHLRRILTKYAAYYNELRTHRSLNKDAPIHRAPRNGNDVLPRRGVPADLPGASRHFGLSPRAASLSPPSFVCPIFETRHHLTCHPAFIARYVGRLSGVEGLTADGPSSFFVKDAGRRQ